MDSNYLLKLVEQNTVHLATLNEEFGTIAKDVAVLKSQVNDLIWYNRFLLAAVLGIVVERVAKAVANLKNNK